jgi:ureidoacrylate peracid hydrolase
MLNYRPLVVSDGNATVSDEAHNASLNAPLTRFADVFSTDEIVGLLTAHGKVGAAKELAASEA